MQMLNLDLNHTNFYCPATGECILMEGEPINEDVQSLLGYWHSAFLDEPVILHPDLQFAWDSYLEKHEKDDEFDYGWESVEDFLDNYLAPNYVVFCITTRGWANGPVADTVWLVIDMNKHEVGADYVDSVGTVALLEADLEACRTALGDKHPTTLSEMNNLAIAHFELGDMAQARVLEEKVLEICQRTLGDDHPATLEAMGNLFMTINSIAVDLRNAGHLDEAEPLQFQAVALAIKAYGEDSLNAAVAFSAMGALLKLKGEMAQALTYLSKSLEIRERELGPDAELTQLVKARLRELVH